MKSMLPTPEELKVLEAIVKYGVDSRFLEKLGGNDKERGIAAAMSIALYAREMDLPVMSCLFGGVNLIGGKPELSPQMENAIIRKSGHILKTIAHDDTKCTIYAKRRDTGEEMTVTATIDDAKRAGIYKNAWTTYPRNMLYKTALSNLAKWLFADTVGIAYVEGEISDAIPFDNAKKEVHHSPAPIQKIENNAVEAIEHKPIEPMISQEQADLIESLMQEEDASYRETVMVYYSENLGRKVSVFTEIPERCRASIIRAISKRKAKREEVLKDEEIPF